MINLYNITYYMSKEEYERTFNQYLKYSWKYAKLYNEYSNELEIYNNIRTDKIIEYKNYFMTKHNDIYMANNLAYNKINYSITLNKQQKKLEIAQNNLKYVDEIYNNLYNKIFNI